MDPKEFPRRVGLGAVVFLGWQIFFRDFKVRYRRAYLGFFWIVAPLIALTAAAALLARQFGISDANLSVPYPLMVLTGLVVWGVFSDGLTLPQQMCRRSRTFLRRAPIPYGAIVVACCCYLTLHFLMKSVLVAGFMIYYGVAPEATAPVALLFVVVTATAGLALGVFLAPISLVYLDIRYGLPFVQPLALLLTPVFYPMQESGTLSVINKANPLTYLILTARDGFIGGGGFGHVGTATMLTPAILICFFLFMWYYYRMMPRGITHI